MSYKFPRNVQVTIAPSASPKGHTWSIALRDEPNIIGEGWTAGAKKDARAEAWRDLETMGLVIDE